jgi:hypothetical protein
MFNSPTPTFGDQQHQHHGGKDGSGTSKQVVQSVKKFIRGLGGGSSSSAPASSTGSPLDTHLSPVFGSAGILHSGGNTSTHGNGGGLVLFSQSLEVLSQRYDPFHANCPHLPPLIEQTIQYLASNGPQANGIFRIAGSVKRMDALRRQFDRFDSSKAVEVFDFSPYTVHDVAGVFKQFLRDLPEPLLSGRLYRFFLAAESII